MLTNLNTLGKFDVVVVGAGPGGIGAAIAAARLNKSVLIIEKSSCAGGVSTNSGCSYLMGFGLDDRQIVGGIADEFVRTLSQMGQAVFAGSKEIGAHPLLSSIVTSVHGIRVASGKLLKSAGVNCLFYSSMIAANTQNRKINSIVVDTLEGLYIVEGNSFVDATADAHLIARAGGETITHPKDECMTKTLFFVVGGMGEYDLNTLRNKYEALYQKGLAPIQYQDKFMAYRLMNKGMLQINMTMTAADGLSSASLTKADYELREQIHTAFSWLKDNLEEFKDSFLADTSFYVGVRAGRSMRGIVTLTKELVDNPAPVSQPIALGMRRYGGHGLRGFAPEWSSDQPGALGIPWGTLISKSFDNAFAAGRCISADSKVIDTFRFMPRCMAIGEAAGITAAMSCGDVNKIDYEAIKEVVLKNGGILK